MTGPNVMYDLRKAQSYFSPRFRLFYTLIGLKKQTNKKLGIKLSKYLNTLQSSVKCLRMSFIATVLSLRACYAYFLEQFMLKQIVITVIKIIVTLITKKLLTTYCKVVHLTHNAIRVWKSTRQSEIDVRLQNTRPVGRNNLQFCMWQQQKTLKTHRIYVDSSPSRTLFPTFQSTIYRSGTSWRAYSLCSKYLQDDLEFHNLVVQNGINLTALTGKKLPSWNNLLHRDYIAIFCKHTSRLSLQKEKERKKSQKLKLNIQLNNERQTEKTHSSI